MDEKTLMTVSTITCKDTNCEGRKMMNKMFPNQKVKCNQCDWKGLREELAIVIVPRYDDELGEVIFVEKYEGCPSCATDDFDIA